jgi:hypothetical protein
MSVKTIITVVLLVFVATSLVYVGMREVSQPVGAGEVVKSVVAAEDVTPFVVYYFHGNVRCTTCEAIEKGTREAVMGNFAKGIEDGTIAWRVVNFDAPENAHFRKEFDLSFQSVVLVEQREGRVARWENVLDVWVNIHEADDVFERFVVETVDKFMATSDS